MPQDRLRLFFALGCPPELAAAIAAWREQLQLPGRPVATANLHLTLAFLGQQPRARLPVLQELAATLHVPPFALQLDQLGRLRNGLLYLAPSQPPRALLQLAAQLQERLQGAGFSQQARRFRPHISLLRHCLDAPSHSNPSFDWQVMDFALFSSEPTAFGRHYRVMQRWPLWRNDRGSGFIV